MDDVVNRMARELSDAIAAAVAEDARVEACRERSGGGIRLKVSLEAVIGFVNRSAWCTREGACAAEGRGPDGRPPAVRDQHQ